MHHPPIRPVRHKDKGAHRLPPHCSPHTPHKHTHTHARRYDPDKSSYPPQMQGLMWPDKVGTYESPGWTGNGMRQEHVDTGKVVPEPDPLGTRSMLFFKGWLSLAIGIRAKIGGLGRWEAPWPMANVGDKSTTWTHSALNETLAGMFNDHGGAGLN